MAKQLSTKLSAFLLLGTVIILAVGVIGFGLMPIAPILAVIGLIMVVARLRGVSCATSQRELVKGI